MTHLRISFASHHLPRSSWTAVVSYGSKRRSFVAYCADDAECKHTRFGVQRGPEISLKMPHFKQRLHQVFSVRINPQCVCLQSRTEPYCWKPFMFLYLKQAHQSIITWICNTTSRNAFFFFFLIDATARREFWSAQQFSSISLYPVHFSSSS